MLQNKSDATATVRFPSCSSIECNPVTLAAAATTTVVV
jgi:hypothetical protein